jgi:hypothetical protein
MASAPKADEDLQHRARFIHVIDRPRHGGESIYARAVSPGQCFTPACILLERCA